MYEPGWRGEAEFNRQVAPTDANLGTTQINPLGTWTPAPGPNESLPITAIDWYEAYAFCIWDGGFLPTQAEWEYAAAGGADQREYPWGDTDPGQQNLYAIYDFCWYEGACGTPPPANLPKTFAPVGSAPLGAGRWGQLDLAGNVDKWFLDTSEGPIVTPCVDCALVTGYYQQYRQFSGGWYNEPSSHLWSSSSMNYSAWYPPARYVAGVRCARVP
jgi:formylglycine-generating enzyme required for sulfatase activity